VRGSSLVETILAVFVLVIAVAFSAASFHASMKYQRVVRQKALGLAFSDLVLDQVREWSRVPTNFSGSWAAWASVTNPNYPDYEARVTAADRPLAMPCSGLSLGVPLAERRTMATSCKWVEVSVFHNAQVTSRINVMIGEPERLATSVSVTPVTSLPGTLAKDGGIEFEAKALDASNRVIPDVFFQWTSAPLTGNGSVVANGPRGVFSNVVVFLDGSNHYTGGQAQVRASCTVRGREISGLSPIVVLQP